MRRLVPVSALLLLLTTHAFAEPVSPLAAGRTLFSGSISFSSAGGSHYENAAGDRTQEWSLQPGGGVFVVDGLAVNLLAAGTWFSQGGVRASQFELGPTLGYWFDTFGAEDPAGHVVPHLGLGVLWGRASEESSQGSVAYNSTFGLAEAGAAFMLTGAVAADLTLQHRFGRFKRADPDDGLRSTADRWSLLWGLRVFLD